MPVKAVAAPQLFIEQVEVQQEPATFTSIKMPARKLCLD